MNVNTDNSEVSRRQPSFRLVFEKQLWHYCILIILLAGILIVSRTEGFLAGQFLGISTEIWFYLALAVAILHQVYVWFCWRMELHYSSITRIFGAKGYTYYSIVFFVLFLSRLVLITGLAISNRHSYNLFDQLILTGLAIICAVPLLYLLYSILRYFGHDQAAGIDHFDKAYRDKPLIKQGIFKYISNPIYVFGMLMFWIPGLLCSSTAALAVALFYHIYVWVHYFFTEKPDMQRIYGNP